MPTGEDIKKALQTYGNRQNATKAECLDAKKVFEELSEEAGENVKATGDRYYEIEGQYRVANIESTPYDPLDLVHKQYEGKMITCQELKEMIYELEKCC